MTTSFSTERIIIAVLIIFILFLLLALVEAVRIKEWYKREYYRQPRLRSCPRRFNILSQILLQLLTFSHYT